jgi:hypothetical protein
MKFMFCCFSFLSAQEQQNKKIIIKRKKKLQQKAFQWLFLHFFRCLFALFAQNNNLYEMTLILLNGMKKSKGTRKRENCLETSSF